MHSSFEIARQDHIIYKQGQLYFFLYSLDTFYLFTFLCLVSLTKVSTSLWSRSTDKAGILAVPHRAVS